MGKGSFLTNSHKPKKALNFVDKKEFDENKGKYYLRETIRWDLFVDYYEYGEELIYIDDSKYGLYSENSEIKDY